MHASSRPGVSKEASLNGIVVYESHWGNTAAIARAIAAGLGAGSRALTTDEVTDAALADADIVVVGAPVIAFGLATSKARSALAADPGSAPPPDVDHPTMRSWLAGLPHREAATAAFETRIWWSPRGATGDIERGMRKAGFRTVTKAARFIVEGTHGPLRDGELDRARSWGTDLAAIVAPGGESATEPHPEQVA
jgi:flavorubredoxin